MNKRSFKQFALFFTGLAVCILPVFLTVILYFPVWKERGGAATLSGFVLLLLLMALVPLFSTLKELLRSPAAYTMWFIAFLLFFLLSKIADEMTVISFVGFISNFIGAFFLRAAKRLRGDCKNEG